MEEEPLSSEEMIRRAREELASAADQPSEVRGEVAEFEFDEVLEVDESEAPRLSREASASRPRRTRSRPSRQRVASDPFSRSSAQAQKVTAAIAVALLIMGIAVAVAVFAAGSP